MKNKTDHQLANQILSARNEPAATKAKNSKDGFRYYFSKDGDIAVGISKEKHNHGYEYVVCLKEDHDEITDIGFINRQGQIYKIWRRTDIDTSKIVRALQWTNKALLRASVVTAQGIAFLATAYVNKVN